MFEAGCLIGRARLAAVEKGSATADGFLLWDCCRLLEEGEAFIGVVAPEGAFEFRALFTLDGAALVEGAPPDAALLFTAALFCGVVVPLCCCCCCCALACPPAAIFAQLDAGGGLPDDCWFADEPRLEDDEVAAPLPLTTAGEVLLLPPVATVPFAPPFEAGFVFEELALALAAAFDGVVVVDGVLLINKGREREDGWVGSVCEGRYM